MLIFSDRNSNAKIYENNVPKTVSGNIFDIKLFLIEFKVIVLVKAKIIDDPIAPIKNIMFNFGTPSLNTRINNIGRGKTNNVQDTKAALTLYNTFLLRITEIALKTAVNIPYQNHIVLYSIKSTAALCYDNNDDQTNSGGKN